MAATPHTHHSDVTVRANPLIRARPATPVLRHDTDSADHDTVRGGAPASTAVVHTAAVHANGASVAARAPSPGPSRRPPKFPRSRAETGDSTDDDERVLVSSSGAASGHRRVQSSNSLASDGASVDTLHSGPAGGSTGGGSRIVQVVNGGSGGSPGPTSIPCGPIPLTTTKDVDLVAVYTKHGPRLRPGNCSSAHVTGPACCTGMRPGPLSRFLQRRVSRAKRRFVEDGFDLDLTYVTDRVIAMGFPSVGLEQLYRNPRHEVARLLHARHPGRHKVYNLCSEPGRRYPNTVFHGTFCCPVVIVRVGARCMPRVACGTWWAAHLALVCSVHTRPFTATACCPFPDHGVPSLQLMYWACEDMARFLARDPENVVAIHCKVNRTVGRAGLPDFTHAGSLTELVRTGG